MVRLMQDLAASAAAGASVNVTRSVANFINDTFVRESIGSRCKYQDEYLRAFDTIVRQTTALTAADMFPSSKLMQMFGERPGSAPRRTLACRDRIQRILERIIQERLESMDRGDDTAAGHGDFLHVFLRLQKEDGTITNRDILVLMFVSSIDPGICLIAAGCMQAAGYKKQSKPQVAL